MGVWVCGWVYVCTCVCVCVCVTLTLLPLTLTHTGDRRSVPRASFRAVAPSPALVLGVERAPPHSAVGTEACGVVVCVCACA